MHNRALGEFGPLCTTEPVPQGRHNPASNYSCTQNPSLFKTSSHEMADLESCYSVPSLAGLYHFVNDSRHFRAGLLIVPSLRDWCRCVMQPEFAKQGLLRADW
jgi:hypothetical protein